MAVLLIDGDIVLYRFASTNESHIDWGDGITSTSLTEDVAKADMDANIKHLVKAAKAESAIVCLSHQRNFRYTVLPTYKHNRQDVAKPTLYDKLKEHIIATQETRMKEWLEADDVMGILATKRPGKFIIATLDKDLKQIPGMHFNWNKDKAVREVTREEGERFFWMQCLMGDSTDGYSGCPGIGPKRAAAILDTAAGAPWEAIVSTYESKGLAEADALQQARVARILRHGEYIDGEVVLWTPDLGG